MKRIKKRKIHRVKDERENEEGNINRCQFYNERLSRAQRKQFYSIFKYIKSNYCIRAHVHSENKTNIYMRKITTTKAAVATTTKTTASMSKTSNVVRCECLTSVCVFVFYDAETVDFLCYKCAHVCVCVYVY